MTIILLYKERLALKTVKEFIQAGIVIPILAIQNVEISTKFSMNQVTHAMMIT